MASGDSTEPGGGPKGTSTDTIVYGVALAVALIAAGLAVANGLSREPEDAESDDPVAAARARAERESLGTTIELPVPSPAAARERPTVVPVLPPVPNLATEPPPPRPTGPDDPRMHDLAAEMRILSRARELLAEHPAEALGVAEEHRRRHPGGALREEREVFAIEALLALERTSEAERRYYDFLRAFPDSAHRTGLERSMLRPPHEIGAGGR